MNEFNEYVRECFSAVGDIVIKPMMGGYLVYLNGKLIGDICDNELFLKRTPTSDRLLADAELRYPYEGSKTLMHVFDRVEDADLIAARTETPKSQTGLKHRGQRAQENAYEERESSRPECDPSDRGI